MNGVDTALLKPRAELSFLFSLSVLFFKQDVTLLYCLFYSKGVRTLQNGHHAVLKKN